MAQNFLDSDDSSGGEGGVSLENGGNFKINEEYANKFAYNKKRDELRRLEEKYGRNSGKRKRDAESSQSSNESSTSEEEDDSGELATEALDSEIFATLNAIKSKDPRVYDPTANFYKSIEEDNGVQSDERKEARPLYLRDYHREVLLNGDRGGDQALLSYNQEQEALKNSIVAEINAAAIDNSSEEDMLVAKQKIVKRIRVEPADIDIAIADKDPEEYLNKFLSTRAWVPTKKSRFQELESDDSEDERRAEEFEEAYNLRFEDPTKSNEKLRTHDREMAAKQSVRREETNSRKKKRESEREKKERQKREILDEKARFRKLRIEEIEDKVQRIKRAAGMKSKDIKPEDWAAFVDGDWDDAQWESEMQKRFGDSYYGDEDAVSDENELYTTTSKRRKTKKPIFDDDIDIKDIIPDFVSDEEANFSLSEDEAYEGEIPDTKESHKLEKQGRKKDAKERKVIEQLVDGRLELDHAIRSGSVKQTAFRYRETSPTSFGLSARDILMAEDSQLNQYVGLKKLAAFRDPAKKRKDIKNLGKRARLRKWRKDAFGDEEGPQASELFAESHTKMENSTENKIEEADGVETHDIGRKKKRRRHKKKNGEQQVLVD